MEQEERQLLVRRVAEADGLAVQAKIVWASEQSSLLITTAAGWSVEHDSSKRGQRRKRSSIGEEKARQRNRSFRTKYRALLEHAGCNWWW